MANRLWVLGLVLVAAAAHGQDLKSILAGAKDDPTLERTETALKEFVKTNASDSLAWLNLGIAQEKRKEAADALASYQKATDLDPQGSTGAEAKMRFALLKLGPQGDDRAMSLLAQALSLRNSGKLAEAMEAAQAARSYAVTVGWQCDLFRANLMAFFGQYQEAETLLTTATATAPAQAKASLDEELRSVKFKEYVATTRDQALAASKSKAPDSITRLEASWRLNPDDPLVGLMLASEAVSAKRYFLAEEVTQNLANSSSAEARAPAMEMAKMVRDLKGMERELKIGSLAELGTDYTLKSMGTFVDPGTDIDDDSPVTFAPEVVSPDGRRKKAQKVIGIDLEIAKTVRTAYQDRVKAWKDVAEDIKSHGGNPADAVARAESARSLVRLAERKIAILEIVSSLFGQG